MTVKTMKHGTLKTHSKEWVTFQKINTDITQTAKRGGGVGELRQGADMGVCVCVCF